MKSGKPFGRCGLKRCAAAMLLLLSSTVGFGRDPLQQPFDSQSIWNAPMIEIYRNDAAWDVCVLVTEWGPAGRVTDELERAWGFEINPPSRDNPWARDMDRIFTNLHVVVKNGPDHIAGGGRPKAPPSEPLDAPTRRIDMRPHWNDRIALANPHKGWFHHFPDNHINKYVIARDEDLTEFPGMDHLYIRLAWAYLEPQEGRFDWDVIDRIIDKWVGHGMGIAFRISCKETSTDRIEQQFATPKWVMESGAEGGFYRNGQEVGPDGPWEPVFDDPIFLEKLENFLSAFAARYDGKPWLRYIDVGSIGDWGEGHLHSGSRKHYGYEPRKRHIDLHVKRFPKTQIVVSDDFVYAISDKQERLRMHRYIVEKGLTYRDDSILVDWFITAHAETSTVRSPELFAEIWRDRPTVLELEHYSHVKRGGNWLGAPDSSLAKFGGGRSGADFFRGALATLRASYIGYHGDARDWYTDNPDLTVELLNRCGYWYFLHHVDAPESLRAGRTHTIRLAWENRGVAPAYHPYALQVRLVGPEPAEFEFDAGNQRWMPGPENTIYTQDYALSLPNRLATGRYDLKIRLHAKKKDRTVFIALDPSLLDDQEYYTVGTLDVE